MEPKGHSEGTKTDKETIAGSLELRWGKFRAARNCPGANSRQPGVTQKSQNRSKTVDRDGRDRSRPIYVYIYIFADINPHPNPTFAKIYIYTYIYIYLYIDTISLLIFFLSLFFFHALELQPHYTAMECKPFTCRFTEITEYDYTLPRIILRALVRLS